MNIYINASGCYVTVAKWINGKYASFRQHSGSRMKRVINSRYLPYRDTQEEAEEDLEAYAYLKGWRVVRQNYDEEE